MVRMENLVSERLEGFEVFGRPHPGTGVYVLLAKGVVLYVGKSLNMFHRIGQHVTAMRRHMKGKRPYKGKEELPFIVFDQIMVKWVPIERIDAEEMKLIQRFLPECNDLMKRTHIDVSNIPGVAKLIKDAAPRVSLMHGNASGNIPSPVRRRAA
jgi:excinuclease UvrABC nuclease subunit